MDSFTNRTFDEIQLGETITRSHRLTRPDVEALAFVSGDVDPFHTDAQSTRQDSMSAEAVAAEALVSALLQRRLPGPGTVIVAQDLRFGGTHARGRPDLGHPHRQGKARRQPPDRVRLPCASTATWT